MTITPWQLYLIMQLDFFFYLCCILAVFAFVSFLVLVLGSISYVADDDFEGAKKWVQLTIKPVIFCSVSSALLSLVPTPKEMCALIVIPKVVNSEIIQKDIPDAAKEIISLSKEWLRNTLNSEGNTGSSSPEGANRKR